MSGPSKAERWLDAIYDQVRNELNPHDEECWHCGGEGETYDCIDGCCVNAEDGCPDCARPCLECRIHEAKFQKAVRIEVIKAQDVALARAWFDSINRKHDKVTDEQVSQQLIEALKQIEQEEKANVEGDRPEGAAAPGAEGSPLSGGAGAAEGGAESGPAGAEAGRRGTPGEGRQDQVET